MKKLTILKDYSHKNLIIRHIKLTFYIDLHKKITHKTQNNLTRLKLLITIELSYRVKCFCYKIIAIKSFSEIILTFNLVAFSNLAGPIFSPAIT